MLLLSAIQYNYVRMTKTRATSDYEALLRSKHLKVTSQRVALLDVLTTAPQPLTVEELHQQLFTSADRVTIYRNVETLVQAKIVKQVDFREGVLRYELEHEHHHHLVCTQCGSITPIYEHCVAVSNQTIQKKYGFTVSEHQLEFFGLCSHCNCLQKNT